MENSAISWTDVRPALSGPKPAAPRDGDKVQARQRVNVEVRSGRRAHPNSFACIDCGHVWCHGGHRHEYDHHLGYGTEQHGAVEPVCSPCHAARGLARGEIKVEKLRSAAKVRSAMRKTHCAKGHPMSYGSDGGWRCHECRLAYWRARGKARG